MAKRTTTTTGPSEQNPRPLKRQKKQQVALLQAQIVTAKQLTSYSPLGHSFLEKGFLLDCLLEQTTDVTRLIMALVWGQGEIVVTPHESPYGHLHRVLVQLPRPTSFAFNMHYSFAKLVHYIEEVHGVPLSQCFLYDPFSRYWASWGNEFNHGYTRFWKPQQRQETQPVYKRESFNALALCAQSRRDTSVRENYRATDVELAQRALAAHRHELTLCIADYCHRPGDARLPISIEF